MTFDKKELLHLIHDDRTVVALHTNNGSGKTSFV